MARKIKEAFGGDAMTQEELNEAEDRIKGKVSPLPAPRPAIGVEVNNPDGWTGRKVGSFVTPAKVGDSGTLKHFKHTPAPRDGWVEMSFEEMAEYEKEGLLMAYCGEEGIGLLKRRSR